MALQPYQLIIWGPGAAATKTGRAPVRAMLVTDESAVAVEAANYFNGAAARLPKGTIIDAITSFATTPSRRALIVTANDGATVTVSRSAGAGEVTGGQAVAALTGVDLTDNSGGAAADTLPAIGAAYVQAEVANAIASLGRAIDRNTADIAAMRAGLVATGTFSA